MTVVIIYSYNDNPYVITIDDNGDEWLIAVGIG